MNENVIKGSVVAAMMAVSGGIGAAISNSAQPVMTSKVEQGCLCRVVQADDPGRRYCGGERPLKVECDCADLDKRPEVRVQLTCGK